MRQDYTDITIVLDRSGSMMTIKTDTEGGFNRFIEDQKKLPGKCLVSLARFDHEYESVYRGIDVAEVKPLRLEPRGMTALYDAIGRAINSTGVRLAEMDEADRPAKVLFVIITDGAENSSREYGSERVRRLIEQQTSQYNWQFVFLGANQDAILTAGNIGIGANAAVTYTNAGTQDTYAALSCATRSFRAGNSYGFTDQDRAAAAK